MDGGNASSGVGTRGDLEVTSVVGVAVVEGDETAGYRGDGLAIDCIYCQLPVQWDLLYHQRMKEEGWGNFLTVNLSLRRNSFVGCAPEMKPWSRPIDTPGCVQNV